MSKKLSTEEFAKTLLVKPSSVRHAYCTLGHYHGAVPTKLPSRRLAWLETDLQRLLTGEPADKSATA